MTHNPPKRAFRYRSVFVSDVHLGSRDSGARYLFDLLQSVDTEYLYLVGDIVDFWSLRKNFFWPGEHHELLRLVVALAQRGTRVVYIPGNHDEVLREYVGYAFGKIAIERETTHVTADGKRLLVLHGDEFDGAIKCASWLGKLGHHAYDVILWLNRHCNRLRGKLGLPYWSLAAFLKRQAGTALKYIDRFERAVVSEARRRGFDGAVCGHIHRPKAIDIAGMSYLNCGDWVENCTALVEDHAGVFSLLHWSERQKVLSRTDEPRLTEQAQAA